MIEENQFELAPDLKISRILNGMWQISGTHGYIDSSSAIDDMKSYHEFGLTTWDLADIYGPAEDFIGEFRKKISENGDASKIQAFTKFVPSPGQMTKLVVEQAINHSRLRMGVDSIDLIQFHWWDYSHNAYHDAVIHLDTLQNDGKIKHLGLTNFDTDHMEIIRDWGINLVSNQVQYSIIDQRPSVKMEKYCKKNNISILAYGTICGGFLSPALLPPVATMTIYFPASNPRSCVLQRQAQGSLP